MVRSGIPVAIGSDGPVSDPEEGINPSDRNRVSCDN